MISPCSKVKQKTINVIDFNKPTAEEILNSEVSLIGFKKEETDDGFEYENVQVSVDTLSEVIESKIKTLKPNEDGVINISLEETTEESSTASNIDVTSEAINITTTNQETSSGVKLEDDVIITTANNEGVGKIRVSGNGVTISTFSTIEGIDDVSLNVYRSGITINGDLKNTEGISFALVTDIPEVPEIPEIPEINSETVGAVLKAGENITLNENNGAITISAAGGECLVTNDENGILIGNNITFADSGSISNTTVAIGNNIRVINKRRSNSFRL